MARLIHLSLWLVALVGCSGGPVGAPASPTAPTTTVAPPVASQPTLQRITVSGATSTFVGQQVAFSAVGSYSNGTTATISPTWASSNTAVATVDGSGRALGLGPGSATITAASSGVTSAATLSVSVDYAGVWRLTIRGVSCSPPARWGQTLCVNFGSIASATLTLSRLADGRYSGTYQYTSPNGFLWTGPVTASALANGRLAVSGRVTSQRAVDFIYSADLIEWSTGLTQSGTMTGSYGEMVSLTGETVQAYLSNEIVTGSR